MSNTPHQDNEPASLVKATQTSFRIVEKLMDLDGAGVRALAKHLDMPKSTVHDHLRSLELCGYIVQVDDGSYRVGARFLELGGYARSQMEIYRMAKPEIEKLASETGEIANLMIEEHGYGIFLAVAKGRDAVQIDHVHHEGMRVPLHVTALGKSIMAGMPDAEVEKLIDVHGLRSMTDNSIDDREELMAELDTIRERGYAIDDEERVEGMKCIGAPIATSHGVAGSLSISAPTKRMQGQWFEEEIPSMILRTANVVEVNLEHR